MKKTRLFGMLALAVALVFGAVSCKQDADAGRSWDDLFEVLDSENLDLSGTWEITEDTMILAGHDTESYSIGEKHVFKTHNDAVFFLEQLKDMYSLNDECKLTINDDRNQIELYVFKDTGPGYGNTEITTVYTKK